MEDVAMRAVVNSTAAMERSDACGRNREDEGETSPSERSMQKGSRAYWPRALKERVISNLRRIGIFCKRKRHPQITLSI